MKRVPGISYIELFVSITIFAMLSMMAMPNFIGWRKRENFKAQVEEIFQMINTARVNSLSEKTCVNAMGSSPTEGWSIIIDPTKITFRCHRAAGGTVNTAYPYDSGLMINEHAMHYYGNHFYNSVFYEKTRGPEQLFRFTEDGEQLGPIEENPESLMVNFAAGTGECSLGESPELRGIMLPMYLPGDSVGLSRFICLDRMAGVPYFCDDIMTASFISNMNLTE